MPLVVHFKRPANWQNTINIHYWDAPADPDTNWPGIAMNAEGNDWFEYWFPSAVAASIIFNEGTERPAPCTATRPAGSHGNTWYDERSGTAAGQQQARMAAGSCCRWRR